MPPAAKPKFTENEKVLCYHGPLLYEAKCVKSKKATSGANAGEYQYFVHYQGWNKNWDEWVGESRILKINPDNLEKKGKLLANHVQQVKEGKKNTKKNPRSGSLSGPLTGSSPLGPGSAAAAGGGSASSTPSGGTAASAGSGSRKSESASTSRASTPGSERSVKVGGASKRLLGDDEQSTSSREDEDGKPTAPPPPSASNSADQQQQPAISRRLADKAARALKEGKEPPRVKITLPTELKYVLASDFELVKTRRHLFNLPAKTTITQILADYNKDRSGDKNKDTISELMLGVRDLFNEYLGRDLLYAIERPQYESVTGDKTATAADLYGSAHLLRLMVKLNDILKNNLKIEEKEDIEFMETGIQDFLEFLDNHRSKYFTSKNYVEATDEYMKKVPT